MESIAQTARDVYRQNTKAGLQTRLTELAESFILSVSYTLSSTGWSFRQEHYHLDEFRSIMRLIEGLRHGPARD